MDRKIQKGTYYSKGKCTLALMENVGKKEKVKEEQDQGF